MSRTERLFDLIQILRNHRFPVSGASLAKELGISLRTLYRDIATLQGQGATVEGEPGFGYVLRPGFMLPPLMFTEEEIEALLLGSRWVSERGDVRLGAAAKAALSKIVSVLPQDLQKTLDASSLMMMGEHEQTESEAIDLSQIRRAIRVEHKVQIRYRDLKGNISERTIWPIMQGYFDHVRMLAGWCERRQGFRHFRAERYPRRRHILLKEWREMDARQRHQEQNSRVDSKERPPGHEDL